MPLVWLNRSWMVISRFIGTRWILPLRTSPTWLLAKDGMYFDNGSLMRSFPCSTSCMIATETIGLVIEKIRNTESGRIFASDAGPCRPIASKCATLPLRPTITTAPGNVPLSTSRASTSDSVFNRADEKPRLSGFAFGRAGVRKPFFFALAAFFAVARAGMDDPPDQSQICCSGLRTEPHEMS